MQIFTFTHKIDKIFETMVIVSPKPGQLSNFIHKDKKSYAFNSDLDERVEILVDAIKYRIMIEEDINHFYPNLLNGLFELRVDIHKWRKENEKNSDQKYHNFLAEKMTQYISLSSFSLLTNVMVSCLEISQQISNALASIEKPLLDIDLKRRDSLGNLFKLVNEQKGILYNRFIEESLKMELGCLIADLIISEKVKEPSNDYIILTANFIKRSIIMHGACAVALEIWKPTSVQESEIKCAISNVAADLTLSGLEVQEFKLTSEKDVEIFFKAIENPPEANATLKSAIKKFLEDFE